MTSEYTRVYKNIHFICFFFTSFTISKLDSLPKEGRVGDGTGDEAGRGEGEGAALCPALCHVVNNKILLGKKNLLINVYMSMYIEYRCKT